MTSRYHLNDRNVRFVFPFDVARCTHIEIQVSWHFVNVLGVTTHFHFARIHFDAQQLQLQLQFRRIHKVFLNKVPNLTIHWVAISTFRIVLFRLHTNTRAWIIRTHAIQLDFDSCDCLHLLVVVAVIRTRCIESSGSLLFWLQSPNDWICAIFCQFLKEINRTGNK